MDTVHHMMELLATQVKYFRFIFEPMSGGKDYIKIESGLYGGVNQWVWLKDQLRASSDSISVQDIKVKGTIIKKITAINYHTNPGMKIEPIVKQNTICYITASPNKKVIISPFQNPKSQR